MHSSIIILHGRLTIYLQRWLKLFRCAMAIRGSPFLSHNMHTYIGSLPLSSGTSSTRYSKPEKMTNSQYFNHQTAVTLQTKQHQTQPTYLHYALQHYATVWSLTYSAKRSGWTHRNITSLSLCTEIKKLQGASKNNEEGDQPWLLQVEQRWWP